MTEFVKRFGAGLLELAYPRRATCMGCDSAAGFPRPWLCEECRQALADRWVGAGDPPPGGVIDGAAYGYMYSGPAVELVHNLKYRGVWRLGEPMGRQMARAMEALSPLPVDCAVAVPMHPRRLRKRGYNHAGVLAEQAAGRLGLPVLPALSRIRNTRQQAQLDDAQRLRNLEGAFALTGDVAGRRVLLVDDVCTTGATANACARTLLEGGAATVYLLCFERARNGKEK